MQVLLEQSQPAKFISYCCSKARYSEAIYKGYRVGQAAYQATVRVLYIAT
jgi:hypothetical protein